MNKKRALTVFALLLLFVVACGGSAEDAPDTSEAPGAEAPTRATVTIASPAGGGGAT